MYFLPESPRWLASRDRHEEALKVLARLHSKGNVHEPYVQAELKEIVAKIAFERQHPQPSYFQLLFGKEIRRTWIGIGVVSNLAPGLLPSKLTCTSNSGNKSPVSTCLWLLNLHPTQAADAITGLCTTLSSCSSKLDSVAPHHLCWPMASKALC